MDNDQTLPQDLPAQSVIPANTTDVASTIISVESTIKSHLSQIDRAKEELKKQKEMLDSILENDPTYKEQAQVAKDANQLKSKTKQNIFKKPDVAHLVEKVKGMQDQVKELNDGLSAYLAQYQMLTGSNQFEIDDEVRDIVYVAKLVKRSK